MTLREFLAIPHPIDGNFNSEEAWRKAYEDWKNKLCEFWKTRSSEYK